MNLLEKNNNDSNILSDKRISIIIKQLPEEINTNFNKKEFNNKIECEEIPNLIPFNNDDKLFYYNNFEIVDKSIYDLLLGHNINSSLYEEKDNYLECIFIEKYILINISNVNSKYIIEACTINDDNNINPLYLLEFDSRDNFKKQIRYVKDAFGVEKYFKSLVFPFNNSISMNDENKKIIGFIYHLEINNKQNLSNEGNYQKSDNLIMDYNKKNLLNEKSGINTIKEEKQVSDPCFTGRTLNKYFNGFYHHLTIQSIIK